MSTAPLRRQRYTFEDFCALTPDEQKADLIDGVIYMASPDNIEGNDICGWLYRLLGDYLDEKELGGKPSINRVAYRLDPYSSPEPDIGYIVPKKLEKVRRGYIDCEPDVAIEIVSEDSEERDYHLKREKYQAAGVREYWIIDPLQEKVTFLRLSRDGFYKEARPRRGIFRSKVIPGFWFDPRWFWQQPLPRKSDVLCQLLERE